MHTVLFCFAFLCFGFAIIHWCRLFSNILHGCFVAHDDVIRGKHFPRYGPFVRVTGEFPSQMPVTRSFDVFDLNKRLCKQQSRRRWIETPQRSLWRHCNVLGQWCECPCVIPHQNNGYWILLSANKSTLKNMNKIDHNKARQNWRRGKDLCRYLDYFTHPLGGRLSKYIVLTGKVVWAFEQCVCIRRLGYSRSPNPSMK